MSQPVMVAHLSMFGCAVPMDVWLRAKRLSARFGRNNYLNEWVEYQYKKGLNG